LSPLSVFANRGRRGEQTATALEASLTNLEATLDEILASFGALREETTGTMSKKDEAREN